MTRGLFKPAVFLAFGVAASACGQDFRVELFSKQRAKSLSLGAGRESARLCPFGADHPCLQLEPAAKVRCVAAAGGVVCSSARTRRRFHNFSVFSPSPFLLEVSFDPSKGSGPTSAVKVKAAEILKTRDGLRVIARVDRETYVRGVLGGEALTLRSAPASEAMSVLARTWAIRWRGRHRSQGFDFCSLTHCQVFRLPPEADEPSPGVVAAAEKTNGQVLKCRGRLIDPYYSAACGGVTAAAADVWPDRAQPYLASVRDPYCAGSEHSSWQRTLPLKTVSLILRGDLRVLSDGPLHDLHIEKEDASGRVHTLRALGSPTRPLNANEFRYAVNRRLGWNTLKSNLYTLDRLGSALVFRGRGLGHGVGLCQAGADQMGRLGIPYQRILATYFPGTTTERAESPAVGQILSSEHFQLAFPPSQQPWAGEALQTLENLHRELGTRAASLPPRIRVQTWETTSEFVRATGQAGWVAASNDGQTILLQPLSTLKRKDILSSTLRHELTHIVVRRLRAPEVGRWFEEGLVLYLTGEPIAAIPNSNLAGRSLDEAISKPRSEPEMKAAYAKALERVRELARQRGEAALWQILERPTVEDKQRLEGQP